MTFTAFGLFFLATEFSKKAQVEEGKGGVQREIERERNRERAREVQWYGCLQHRLSDILGGDMYDGLWKRDIVKVAEWWDQTACMRVTSQVGQGKAPGIWGCLKTGKEEGLERGFSKSCVVLVVASLYVEIGVPGWKMLL